MLAHGTNPGLIGKSLLEFKDVDGKPITQDALAVKDIGWIRLQMAEPADEGGRAKGRVYRPRWGIRRGGWRVQMMSMPASFGAIRG